MDMTTVHEWAENATMDELSQVNKICCAAMKDKYEEQARGKRRKYKIGDIVKFFATHGRTVSGTIVRINKKTLSLEDCSDGKKWRVGYEYVI